jgi:hypothetical protein
MARLNASNPSVVYGRQSPTKTQPYSFQRTTISSPLRPKPKQAPKTSGGFSDFKIFEDDDDDDEERLTDEVALTEPSHTTQKKPLKLTHTNSITSGLSKRASQESSASLSSRSRSSSDFDEEESSDKENIFLDDEAEETSAESEEEEGEEDSRNLADLDGGSNLEGEVDRTPQFMQYRESRLKEESDDSPSEYNSESEDEDSSLQGFIVDDDEDLSYHESENGLDESEEEEEEIKPPTPKPTRRRLLRGRKPRDSSITEQTKNLNVSVENHSPHLVEAATPPKPSHSTIPPRLTSFTRLSPNKTHSEGREVTKNTKAQRSPLRESINSVYVSDPIHHLKTIY